MRLERRGREPVQDRHDPVRGIVHALIFVAPFWTVVLLALFLAGCTVRLGTVEVIECEATENRDPETWAVIDTTYSPPECEEWFSDPA